MTWTMLSPCHQTLHLPLAQRTIRLLDHLPWSAAILFTPKPISRHLRINKMNDQGRKRRKTHGKGKKRKSSTEKTQRAWRYSTSESTSSRMRTAFITVPGQDAIPRAATGTSHVSDPMRRHIYGQFSAPWKRAQPGRRNRERLRATSSLFTARAEDRGVRFVGSGFGARRLI